MQLSLGPKFSRPRLNNRVSIALACVLLLLLLSMVATYCWGLNKGLDLIDEGDFLLSSTNPFAYPQPSAYAFFMVHIPAILAPPILNFRLAALVAELSSALVLCWSFTMWLKRFVDFEKWNLAPFSVTLVTLSSSLLFSTIFASTIAYNVITAFFLYLSVAFLFFAQSCEAENSSGWNYALHMVASGFMLAFSFFAKFTSCFCVYALTVVFVALSGGRRRSRGLAWHGLGVLVGVCGYFCFFESIANFWQRIDTTVLGLEFGSGSSHAPAQVFVNSVTSAMKHGPELTVLLCAFVLLPFFLFLSAKIRRTLVLLLPIGALVLMIGVWSFRAFTHHELHSSLVYWPVVFIAVLFLTTMQATGLRNSFPDNPSRLRVLCGFALLASLPFALSFGTNGPILWHALGNIAPLFLCIGYLSVLIGTELGAQWVPFFSLFLMASVSFAQFVNGYVLHYKDGPASLSATVCMPEPARMRGIYLEPATATFIEQGNALLRAHGFVDGDPILGFYDLPGFVYAVGGNSPMFARYGQPFPIQNDYFLSRLPRKKWERLFLIVNDASGSAVPTPSVLKHLKNAGLDFPQNFESIGKVFRPNQFWNGGSTAYFYALRQ